MWEKVLRGLIWPFRKVFRGALWLLIKLPYKILLFLVGHGWIWGRKKPKALTLGDRIAEHNKKCLDFADETESSTVAIFRVIVSNEGGDIEEGFVDKMCDDLDGLVPYIPDGGREVVRSAFGALDGRYVDLHLKICYYPDSSTEASQMNVREEYRKALALSGEVVELVKGALADNPGMDLFVDSYMKYGEPVHRMKRSCISY